MLLDACPPDCEKTIDTRPAVGATVGATPDGLGDGAGTGTDVVGITDIAWNDKE